MNSTVAGRMRWDDAPLHVRGAVDTTLGAPVVDARTRAGGFSPGVAARVRLANGRSAFVKALSASHHRPSIDLYRMEAATMAHLPPGLPVPQLLDAYDDGDWVALVYKEVVGRQPAVPWRQDK